MKTFQYHELKTPWDGDNGELYPDYPLDSLTVRGKMFHLDLNESDLMNIEDLFRSLRMGLIKCARKDCENVICNRYNPHFGYICDECYDEFINYLVGVDYNIRAEEEGIRRFVKAFLIHPKDFKFGDRNYPLQFCEDSANKTFPFES